MEGPLNGEISHLHTRHDGADLSTVKSCSKHFDLGSAVPTELPRSRRKWISLSRENSGSDAGSEGEEVRPLSAEDNGEKENPILLRGPDTNLGTSVVTTCCKEKTRPSDGSSSLEEESRSSGANSRVEGETGLSGISSCWQEETGPPGVSHRLDDEKPVSKTRLDIYAIGEQEQANSKSEHFTFERESSIAEEEIVDAPCVMDNSHLEDEHYPIAPSISKNYEDVSINSSQYVANQAVPGIVLDEVSHCVKLLESCLQEAPRAGVGTRNDSYSNQLTTESSTRPLLDVDGLIFVMGGYDGLSWLPRMECYSPSLDAVTYLKQMSVVRSNASAAVLNGVIYNCGGWNGYSKLWYDTVECYNPQSNECILCPPLSEKKGSLAATSLNNKIFAAGGGNGIDCFRAVEMFDPVIERWIPTQSMRQKGFASAAAVLDGVLYVVGGYDGKTYLKSAERFDLREVSWSKLPNMNTCRGSHALTVFQGKLYALGGYDGNDYIANVEIYDPRMGSWMEGDEMRQPRGYFAAPVISDTIYAIGGQTVGSDILDSVEIYKLGHGWSETKLNGIGARCLFSAVAC